MRLPTARSQRAIWLPFSSPARYLPSGEKMTSVMSTRPARRSLPVSRPLAVSHMPRSKSRSPGSAARQSLAARGNGNGAGQVLEGDTGSLLTRGRVQHAHVLVGRHRDEAAVRRQRQGREAGETVRLPEHESLEVGDTALAA